MPESLGEEMEISYLNAIVSTTEKNNIPTLFGKNLDQTPTEYVPGNNKTMAFKGLKSLPMFGSTDKQMITATFIVTPWLEVCTSTIDVWWQNS